MDHFDEKKEIDHLKNAVDILVVLVFVFFVSVLYVDIIKVGSQKSAMISVVLSFLAGFYILLAIMNLFHKFTK